MIVIDWSIDFPIIGFIDCSRPVQSEVSIYAIDCCLLLHSFDGSSAYSPGEVLYCIPGRVRYTPILWVVRYAEKGRHSLKPGLDSGLDSGLWAPDSVLFFKIYIFSFVFNNKLAKGLVSNDSIISNNSSQFWITGHGILYTLFFDLNEKVYFVKIWKFNYIWSWQGRPGFS